MKSRKSRKSKRSKKTRKYYGGIGRQLDIYHSSDKEAQEYIDGLSKEEAEEVFSINIATNTGLTKVPNLNKCTNAEIIFITMVRQQNQEVMPIGIWDLLHNQNQNQETMPITLEHFDVNNLPENIDTLRIEDTNIKKIPDLTRFTKLFRLSIIDNNELEIVGKLPQATIFKKTVDAEGKEYIEYKGIVDINIERNNKLSIFRFGIFPESLVVLKIKNCPSMEILPKIPYVDNAPIRFIVVSNTNAPNDTTIFPYNRNMKNSFPSDTSSEYYVQSNATDFYGEIDITKLKNHKKIIEKINHIFDEKLRKHDETIKKVMHPLSIYSQLGDDYRTIEVQEYMRQQNAEDAQKKLPVIPPSSVNERKRKPAEEHGLTVNKRRQNANNNLGRTLKKMKTKSSEKTKYIIEKEMDSKELEKIDNIIKNIEKDYPGFHPEVYERFHKLPKSV